MRGGRRGVNARIEGEPLSSLREHRHRREIGERLDRDRDEHLSAVRRLRDRHRATRATALLRRRLRRGELLAHGRLVERRLPLRDDHLRANVRLARRAHQRRDDVGVGRAEPARALRRHLRSDLLERAVALAAHLCELELARIARLTFDRRPRRACDLGPRSSRRRRFRPLRCGRLRVGRRGWRARVRRERSSTDERSAARREILTAPGGEAGDQREEGTPMHALKLARGASRP